MFSRARVRHGISGGHDLNLFESKWLRVGVTDTVEPPSFYLRVVPVESGLRVVSGPHDWAYEGSVLSRFWQRCLRMFR